MNMMTEMMDEYYQILGLTPGASEEQIKQAYKDLVRVWHPDRFPNNQRLRNKADEKIKEINLAYERLKSHIAQNSRESVFEPQPSLDGTPPGSGKGKSSAAESRNYGKPGSTFKAGNSRHFAYKFPTHISWKLLALFFVILGLMIGTNLNHKLIGAALGLLIGMGVGRLVNHMDKTRKYKVRVMWGVAISGLILFVILFGLSTSRHARSTSSGLSSFLYQSSPSNHLTSLFDPDPATENNESQKIGFLFECIRQANLQKDIDLFMSCFSRDFVGAETKRKDTLKMWDTFNYYDLTYEFKRLTIKGDIADVRLEWIVTASEKLGGKSHNATMVLDVALKREDGCWRIMAIKPIS
jgi:ketosteroid isomerase-like protein